MASLISLRHEWISWGHSYSQTVLTFKVKQCLLSRNQICARADVKKSLKCFSIATPDVPEVLPRVRVEPPEHHSVRARCLLSCYLEPACPEPPCRHTEGPLGAGQGLAQPLPAGALPQPLHHLCFPGLAPLQAPPASPALRRSPSPASCNCGCSHRISTAPLPARTATTLCCVLTPPASL